MSVLRQRNARGMVKLFLAGRPEGIAHSNQKQQRKIGTAPACREFRQVFKCQCHIPAPLANIGFVIIDLEIDLRAQLLQIGDHSIKFGQTSLHRRKITDLCFGIALEEGGCILILGHALQESASPEVIAERASVFPIPRVGQPDEIAEAFLYLASDAARYVTGITIPVDGGLSLGTVEPLKFDRLAP